MRGFPKERSKKIDPVVNLSKFRAACTLLSDVRRAVAAATAPLPGEGRQRRAMLPHAADSTGRVPTLGVFTHFPHTLGVALTSVRLTAQELKRGGE